MGSSASLPAADIVSRLRAQLGEDVTESSEMHGDAVVRVAPSRYRELVLSLRDDPALAFDFIDFVAVVDRQDEGFDVVTQLYSNTHHGTVRVKVACDRENPTCPTISDLYPGADWHEREGWEMFGVTFEGHPGLIKLLLPEEFEGHPGRKDFVLMSRVAKPWPGAVEGEEEEE